MKIYTGYYGNIDKYIQEGLVLISISRTIPFNIKLKGIEVKKMAEFAPSAGLLIEWKKNYDIKRYYDRFYFENLNNLNKKYVLNKIKELANNKDCVLLCYEKSSFCHRHLVADWMKGVVEIKEF